jgi:tetratricopeptide (TPR) repeat protein
VVSGCIIAARNQALSMASPEDEEEKKCRVCWGDEDDGPLVQPCVCRGSMKWIHERCLEKWRRTGARVDAAYRCGQCMDEYRDALSLELLSARLQAERTDGLATNLTLSTLASELEEQGKYDEAETLYREAMEAMRETLGSRHPSTLTSLSNLGKLLHRKGDLDAAGPLLREAVEGMRATLGSEHPATLNSVCVLSSLLRDEGDLAAAETLLR